MQTSIIKIAGMHCRHCVASVHDALMSLDGVDRAEVNLDEGTATVSYDADAVSVEAMNTAIFDQGFDVVE